MSDRVAGSVIAIHGSLVRVQTGDQTLVVAARRKLAWEGGQPAVPGLAVGDHVTLEVDGEEGVVVSARRRRNAVLSADPASGRPLVVAANIDQALLVVAARQPRPRQSHVDRLLAGCRVSGVDATITVNKRDQGLDVVAAWLDTYRRLGYPTLAVSVRSGWGLGQLRRLLAGRTTLFCGPPGVGKSALLNAVYPGFRLKPGSIAMAPSAGRPAVVPELMPLPFGGFVVDTPGLPGFGLEVASAADLVAAFPEIAAAAGHCQASGCAHADEPGCRVREEVAAGRIDPRRCQSWRHLVDEREDDED